MLTVFLWILLIFLFLLLLSAILPIRFCLSAKHTGSERFNYEFIASYFHPLFLKLIYSSENGKTLKIFGRTFKPKQKKESEELPETIKYSDKKTVEPQEREYEYSSTPSEEKSVYDSENTKSQSRETVETYDDTHEEDESQEERVSLINRIKTRIDKIKKGKAYLFLSDAVWRKKIKTWLGRCLKLTFALIVFHHLKIWVKIGLMNPATLGKLCGYFNAARSALSLRSRKIDMTLEPLFMKELLEFEAELKGGTSLLRLTLCFFMALLTFPYIRTYKIQKQWKRKNSCQSKN